MSTQMAPPGSGLGKELARLPVRMNRVEATTEKTLAIVQGLVHRVDGVEKRLGRLEHDMREVKLMLTKVLARLP